MVEEYNRTMAERMGWAKTRQGLNPYEYHPERGLYFHAITPRMILGSQPRSPSDIAHLANHQGVSAILNMQQDRDLHHWAVDLDALKRTAAANGITYLRAPAIDFDPGSLRRVLPTAVAQLLSLLRQGKTVYVHCSAGLGRAPAVCIAALYWEGLGILSEDAQDLVRLDEAYDHVTGIRACGPNKDAIRGATGDLLSGRKVGDLGVHGSQAFATLHARDRTVILERLPSVA